MKVLFPALRVRDLGSSLAFHTSVGFGVAGQVDDGRGTRIELVQWPPGHPTGMTRADLALRPGP